MELLFLMSLSSFLLFNAHITSAENYYQALNAEISIENGALGKFIDILNNFTEVETTEKDKIMDIEIAQDCETPVSCKCGKHFTRVDDGVCIPNGRVSVNGTVTLTDKLYSNELTQKNSPTYKQLSEELTEKFSTYYSKLKWFQSLSIQQFRKGSVIVDFKMTLDRPTNEGLGNIDNITSELEKNVTGKAKLVTEGFVKITVPKGRVRSHINESINCETNHYISPAAWYFTREHTENVTEIHGGTEVIVSDAGNKSTATLLRTSDIWRGTYTCEFKEGKVSHQAHSFLDVAILPQINIYSEPQFPNCRKKQQGGKLDVVVTCAVKNTTENYKISWTDQDFLKETTTFEKGDRLYPIRKTINCESGIQNLNVTCTFTNGLNQSQPKELTIPVIHSDSKVCEEDGDWPIAKAGYEAKLNCEDSQRGERTRKCGDGEWETEISKCVNVDLDRISAQAMDLHRGLGNFKTVTPTIFQEMKTSTQREINSTANIATSVTILKTVYNVSVDRNSTLQGGTLPDLLASVSNIINGTLKGSWNGSLAAQYLQNVNGLLEKTNINNEDPSNIKTENVKLQTCSSNCEIFKAKVDLKDRQNISVTGFVTLGQVLPLEIKNENDTLESRGIVLQVNALDLQTFYLNFSDVNRTQNHELHCVVWDPDLMKWSKDACTWGGANNPGQCKCEIQNNNVRSSNRYTGAAFTVLMSKNPVILPFMDQLTITGLIVSIVSLIACLVIEFLVWNSVVKSSIAHFRHTAVVNISLCLLLADSSFLSTAFPQSTPSHWCRWLVVVKHYCFLAMFFWMLCLSLVLLHSLIFIFQRLRKKVYLGVSFSVGYVCPLMIVVLTVIAYDNGEVDSYYKKESCWLKYEGLFKGSFYAFVMPVGIIVGINVLSMLVVIAKLLAPSVSESRTQDDKDVIRSILKAVIFLTPVFGVTWLFGFFILVVDHTTTPLSEIVNYAFTVCNAFQGLFILLTACLGEKKVREALSVICSCKSKVYKTSRGEHSTSKTSNGSSLKKK